MSDRQGIEIDYCPTCRGVWLDRGELDKIIERSSEIQKTSGYNPHNHMRENHQPYGHDNHRKKNFLEGLFD
jgi:Zn-finger nucleic acid-binding protein